MTRSHLVTSLVIGIILLFRTNVSFGHIYGFEVIFDPQNTNSKNASIGENQLSVDVAAYGKDQAIFWFRNVGGEDASITDVYFEDGALLEIATLIDADDPSPPINGLSGHPDVDFSEGANPPDLPRGNLIGFTTTRGFLADSDTPPPKKGVNPGEYLGIMYDLQSDKVFDDVIADLAGGDLRIGIHVQDFDSGGSESFVNIVPIPGAVVLYVSGCGLFGWIAGRKYFRKKLKS